MLVFDPEAGSCRIFEIKHSEKAAPQKYCHLIDAEKDVYKRQLPNNKIDETVFTQLRSLTTVSTDR